AGIGKMIYDFDMGSFEGIQRLFGSEFADNWMIYVGNLFFWTPLFVFVLVMLFRAKREVRWLNLLFAAGSFVLSYQCAILLGRMFARPAPFHVESLFLLRPIPELSIHNMYSLPDWAIAATFATLLFSHVRIRAAGQPFPIILWSVLVIPVIARIYAGYAYPVDIILGMILGIIIGQFMVHFARNVEIVMAERRR
ncbi:MAG: hypothetical protein AAF570_13305, partial [Bacteroidota bacterium]